MGEAVKEKPMPTGEGLTFEKVWAMFQEVAERQRETDRMIKETAAERQKEAAERKKEDAERKKEIDRMFKEAAERQKEADKRQKELDRRMGYLDNRFGEMVEYQVMPNMLTKFHELGMTFTRAMPNNVINDGNGKFITEVDITLTNRDKVMIVEVKSKPSSKDIKEHLKRMEKVKADALLHGDQRIYLGAIAGVVFMEDLKKFAMKSGFYVIEPSGETFAITVPTGEYSPREW